VTGEEQEQRRRRIVVEYTLGAEAAGRVGRGSAGGGGGSGAAGAGAGAGEGRHWDWERRMQKGLPGHSRKQVHTSREAPYDRAAGISVRRYRAGQDVRLESRDARRQGSKVPSGSV
jgi:hypothetical protein